MRVVEYTLDDGGPDHDEMYRLITTITDPGTVSPAELAAAYTQRWEIATAFDELKTHQRGPRRVLRSAKPDLVTQEIWEAPVLPLCDQIADVRRHSTGRQRPGPSVICHCTASHTPLDHPRERFPLKPQTSASRYGPMRSGTCANTCSRPAGIDRIRASSNASMFAGMSNAPNITAGPNHTDTALSPSQFSN